jgi:ornithine cyclodeaminase
MLLIDAGTGAPACLFQDEGWMTEWRTAAAVALAAACLAPRADAHVGIVGTGQQAQLAIEWIAELMPAARFSLCGRDAARTRAISARHAAQSIDSIADLLAQCDVIVTVTPATQALFDADQARPRQHFVAVGADGAEKQELPQALYARAQIVVTDDHAQCLALSDFGRAVRDGYIARDADHALGALLAATIACDRQPRDITIVDLTGLAAQDIAIANLFLAKLKHAGRWPMPGDLPFDA